MHRIALCSLIACFAGCSANHGNQGFVEGMEEQGQNLKTGAENTPSSFDNAPGEPSPLVKDQEAKWNEATTPKDQQ